jgi:hypothetical protein
MFAKTSGHASYVRGALTMLVAMAAYIGGWLLVAQVATAKANKPSPKPPVVDEGKAATEPDDSEAKDAEGKDSETADENKDADTTDESKDAEAAPKAPAPKAAPQPADSTRSRAIAPRRPLDWRDFICLAIAALVAYELGRGSEASSRSDQAASSARAGTHPDA